ncbi:BTB/POZ domain-containing protein At2g30600 isoform X2 [Syzygium oleosum]|nr:BTB/POZ domain-containing protein At2g30600 isoform X2 [Syzygium oleosum]
MAEKEKKFLRVAPFECAWSEDLMFREAGRGCVAFEAFARNDVTVVFRENVGSQHYHYKRDNCPHYTVILGSHRNRRFKIEVDGKTAVDEAGVALCSSSAFQSYWISIYDGLISVGQGRYPFQNLVFQWLDTNPNCSVRYVGLSSWDKHVGYRNVSVLPLTQNPISIWKQMDWSEHKGEEGKDDVEMGEECSDYENWGLENFLESWELSDVYFIVGEDKRPVPAHRVILGICGNFNFCSSSDVIRLQDVEYPVLHSLLQYVYSGHTQAAESELGSLMALALQFEVMPLVKQCQEMIGRFKLNKNLFHSGKNVELSYPSSRPHSTVFPFGLPVNIQKLKQLPITGEHSDVKIYIDCNGLAAQAHKVILSLWSIPFAKMFTNGMAESISSEICLKDVSSEAFSHMVSFMYSGEINMEDGPNSGNLLLQLLLLADQFGVTLLHQECCKLLLECLSEDSICPILQAVSMIPSCKLIEETSKRNFATHFDYFTTASMDFILLDDTTFSHIIQHPDLTVTSEERVLNAILMWCMKAKNLLGWEAVDELMNPLTPEVIFADRLHLLNDLLPFVRFALLPHALLKKLKMSNLSKHIPVLDILVTEVLSHTEMGLTNIGTDKRFQHRRSSFKELQYICDGDSNGVMYFAGTSYGEHQWVNPVIAKRISITASSPFSRYTDPKVLISRTFQGTSFTGPRIEDGHNCSWWMVDIGEDHQLMCNYYTLRQDGSRAYMRFWKLQ